MGQALHLTLMMGIHRHPHFSSVIDNNDNQYYTGIENERELSEYILENTDSSINLLPPYLKNNPSDKPEHFVI